MLKRFFLTLAFVAGLIAPVHAAGTISLSLTQQIDKDTLKPLAGGKLYLFQAGTTTPQNAYSDTALTIPLPNPITLDAAGRLPQMFFADGQIKFRLTNAQGVTQLAQDNILVVGPSSGGGGGGSVDPTTVASTGDMKCRYATGVLTGWVRTNARTIGSASSGATERANADTQTLFEYLWNTDPNLAVSTGRGASSLADWTANKTIALPDSRGRALASLDDMGNSAAGRLTATYFGATPTTLGAARDGQSVALGIPHLPPITPSGSVASTWTQTSGQGPGQNQSFSPAATSVVAATVQGGAPGAPIQISVTGTVASTFFGNPVGGTSTPFSILPPMLLVTCYVKL